MAAEMEVKVHPADPCKVLVRKDPSEDWTACDNILGEFDDFLSPEEIEAREREPFFLHQVDD